MNPKDFEIGVLAEISKTSHSFFWILALIGICSIILARINNNTYINNLLNFSQNYNQKAFFSQSLSSLFLVLNYLIAITLFILIIIHSFSQSEVIFSATYGFKILLSVFIFYFLKTSIQYLIASIFLRKNRFDLRNAIKQYQILGLILLPISIFSLYQSSQFQYSTFIIGAILIAVVSIVQAYNSAKESLQYKISLFYIILYLCTLEILPIFFLAKYFLG